MPLWLIDVAVLLAAFIGTYAAVYWHRKFERANDAREMAVAALESIADVAVAAREGKLSFDAAARFCSRRAELGILEGYGFWPVIGEVEKDGDR